MSHHDPLCGCHVAWADDDSCIAFCRLHANAERMREALMKIRDLELYGPDCTCSEDCSCGDTYMRKIAKEVLALTGGEPPK